MPTYQYACTECGHQLEAVQSFSDPSLVECPECAGRLRKLYSGVGIVFKGSGFYRTDSRASATSSSTSTGKDGASDSSAKSESTTKDSASKDSSTTKSEAPKPAPVTTTTPKTPTPA